MMQKTNINYLTHTCNPIAMRCTPVSPGCANCWHLKLCDMHAKNPKMSYQTRKAKAGGPPILRTKELSAISSKKAGRIGLQFMGDLFHEQINIRGDLLGSVFDAMACSDATFLLLTKRPKRMANSIKFFYSDELDVRMDNLWLGTSCENQKWFDIRAPHLFRISAAVQWLSLEPLLGPIDMLYRDPNNKMGVYYDPETNKFALADFVVIGCESGPVARPCKLEWVQSLVEQCKAAGVACWVKQIPINGKVETDMNKFPKELQVRELPK